jgi:hypothetical protein
VVLHSRTVRFEAERRSVRLSLGEAKEFQYRLSLAPGGHSLEREIDLAIDNDTPVVVADGHKAAAVSVLRDWSDEVGGLSLEADELLAMLMA